LPQRHLLRHRRPRRPRLPFPRSRALLDGRPDTDDQRQSFGRNFQHRLQRPLSRRRRRRLPRTNKCKQSRDRIHGCRCILASGRTATGRLPLRSCISFWKMSYSGRNQWQRHKRRRRRPLETHGYAQPECLRLPRRQKLRGGSKRNGVNGRPAITLGNNSP